MKLEAHLKEGDLLTLHSLLQPLAKAECAFVKPVYVSIRDLRARLSKVLAECEEEKKARKTTSDLAVTVRLDRDLPLRKKPKKKTGRGGGVQGATGVPAQGDVT
jgi:hypothetical protein